MTPFTLLPLYGEKSPQTVLDQTFQISL